MHNIIPIINIGAVEKNMKSMDCPEKRPYREDLKSSPFKNMSRHEIIFNNYVNITHCKGKKFASILLT